MVPRKPRHRHQAGGRVKRGTPRHFKMDALSERLGISLPHAVGIMEMLWHWAAESTPQGDIGKASDRAIANAVCWDRDSSELIAALIETRWLDRCPVNRLVIHDWEQHCEQSVKKYLQYWKLPFIQCVTISRRNSENLRESPASRVAEAEAEAEEKASPEKTETRVLFTTPPALPPEDPFVVAGFESDFDAAQWWRAVVKRHPNPNHNANGFNCLRDLVLSGNFNRSKFEAWYEKACKDPRWKERGGMFCPNLFSILHNGLWNHDPPDFSQFADPKPKSLAERL